MGQNSDKRPLSSAMSICLWAVEMSLVEITSIFDNTAGSWKSDLVHALNRGRLCFGMVALGFFNLFNKALMPQLPIHGFIMLNHLQQPWLDSLTYNLFFLSDCAVEHVE